MARGFREILSAWEDWRVEVDEYRELVQYRERERALAELGL